jgi:hypothetical protein
VPVRGNSGKNNTGKQMVLTHMTDSSCRPQLTVTVTVKAALLPVKIHTEEVLHPLRNESNVFLTDSGHTQPTDKVGNKSCNMQVSFLQRGISSTDTPFSMV